jgi:hypothetical protein
MTNTRALSVFVDVEAFVDGKRVGGHATFMRIADDVTTCKELLEPFLQSNASDYSPLPVSTCVVMMCAKLGDTLQARSASNVDSLKNCTFFLDYPVTTTMAEVPSKRFTIKCSSQIEDQRPRRDPIVFMMAQRTVGFTHLPSPRVRSFMNAKDILYNDIIQYLNDNGVGFPVDVTPSLGVDFVKHLTSALFSFES